MLNVIVAACVARIAFAVLDGHNQTWREIRRRLEQLEEKKT